MSKNTPKVRSTATLTAFVLLLILITTSAQAAESENSLDVTVNISQKTIIDIQPKSFSWGAGSDQVLPGEVVGQDKELNNYSRIQLENLGSVNITQVWFNTSYPSERPFGTGDRDKYDSGNLIAINDTGTNYNQFVNRKEYGLDQPNGKDIIYLDTPSGWDYGRFRSSSQEYFWTVDDTTSSLQDEEFRIGIEPHNSTQTGSTDFTSDSCDGLDESGSNTNCNGYNLDNVSVDGTWWAYTNVEIGGDDAGLGPDNGPEYCAVMNASQVVKDGASERPEVWFIKWNKNFPATNTADCNYVTNYTVGSSASTENLVPGEWINREIRARVPYGVVADKLPPGDLWVLANSG